MTYRGPIVTRRHLPLLVALLLCAVAPLLDFYGDDWLVRMVVRGRAPGSDPNPVRLYEFMSSEAQVRGYLHEGMLPWWSDPLLKIRFLRPLSSLLMWVDHRVLVTPLLGHLHSLGWFVLYLVCARRVLDRVLSPRAARWALWTLCLAGYHAGTVLWLSARNGLSASTVALLALHTHLDDRLDDRPVRSLRVAALFALSLLFAETALGLVPMLLAVEALAVRKPVADRVRAVAPTALVAVAYLVVYAALGYGVSGAGGYLDPIHEPLRFIAQLPVRWMTLVSEALVGTLSEIALVVPASLPVTGALGALALGLAGYALHRTRGDRPDRYVEALAVGSLLALVPAVGGILGGRLLALAGLGAALAMGALADAAMQRNRRWLLAPLAVVMVFGVMSRLVQGATQLKASREERGIAQRPVTACPVDADRALIEAGDPGVAIAGAIAASEWPGFRGRLRVLSMEPVDHVVTRLSEQTIELRPTRGVLVSSFFAQVYRRPSVPLREGERIDAGDAQLVMRSVVDGRPRRVEVTFARPLADRSTCLLRWRGGRLEPFDPPPVGASVTLRHEPGPVGM